VEAVLVRKDEVIRGLFQAEGSEDPEVSWRAAMTLELVFLRLEKGDGAPQTGLEIKSKIVTLNLKIGTRPMAGDVKEGSAAEEGGLEKGDLILKVNGVAFEGEDGTAQLTEIFNDQVEGAELVIKYSRHGEDGRSEGEATLVLGKPQLMPRDLSSHRQEFNNWKTQQRVAAKEE
jgi:C-terminal processing protease CtpA/Prc